MSTRNSRLLVYESDNIKFTCKFSIKTLSLHFSFTSARICNFSIKTLSTLIVYGCENRNILSTFLVYEYKKIAL